MRKYTAIFAGLVMLIVASVAGSAMAEVSITANPSSITVTAGGVRATSTLVGYDSDHPNASWVFSKESGPEWATVNGATASFAPGASVTPGTYSLAVNGSFSVESADATVITTLTTTTITITVTAASDTPAANDYVLQNLQYAGYVSGNELKTTAFSGDTVPSFTVSGDKYVLNVRLMFDVTSWRFSVAGETFTSSAVSGTVTETGDRTATIVVDRSSLPAGSNSAGLSVLPAGASTWATISDAWTLEGSTTQAYYNEGNDGSSWETAYIIDSAEDFMMMRNGRESDTGKYFKLTADIDLTGESNFSSGTFSGHLDGQNHTVKINIVGERLSYLFYEVTSDATAIMNLNVTGSASNNNSGATGVIGNLYSGAVENCSFSGTVRGPAGSGLIGTMFSDKATVRNCTFSGQITITEGSNAGGIVDIMEGGSVENCTVAQGTTITCPDTSSARLGGIVGRCNVGYVMNCTSYAVLEGGTPYKGGIAGATGTASLSGNAWLKQYPEIGGGSGSGTLDSQPSPGGVSSRDSVLPPGVVQPISLSDDVLEKVASAVSVDVSQIHTLTQENITPPKEPTQAMRDYARNDNTELTGKLNTIKVDAEGWYVFKVTLSDELWNKVRSNDVSGYKFYGLHDSEAQVSASFINGVLNTWELFSLSGEKFTSFGAREFLMVAFLNASEPFSLFLAKMLLMLLGGCNTLSVPFIAAGILLLLFRKR